MGIRKIKKSYRSVTGVLASRKNDRMVASESTLERDLYNLLEFDPLIESYDEQPVTIPYKMAGGATSKYTPDVIINFKENPEFIWQYSPFRAFFTPEKTKSVADVKNFLLKPRIGFIPPKAILAEVKYRTDLKKYWKELKPKFKAARLFAAERNWQFRIFTEKEIRTPLLNNIKFMRPFARREFPVEQVMKVLDILTRSGSCRVEDLLKSLSENENERRNFIPVVWQLVSQHEIGVDWNRPLTISSMLSTIV